MVAAPTAFVNYGVDYLTCTYKPQANLTRLEFYLSQIERSEKAHGNYTEKWAMQGYSGFHIGGLDWGLRDDGCIVRLSGATAKEYWAKVGKLASNCSRIDLQTTVSECRDLNAVVQTHYKEMRKKWQSKKKFPEPKMWVGPQGAEAIYSGSRHSQRYLRLYRRFLKDRLSGTETHLRYEAEIKSELAKVTLSRLLASSTPDDDCRSQCYAMFRDRGLSLEWTHSGQQPFVCPRTIGNVTRRLRWLENAVRPSVERLIAEGYRDQVLSALGFLEKTEAPVVLSS